MLKMRQGGNALRVVALSLGVLIASWWFGSETARSSDVGAFYRIWVTSWAFIAAAGVLGVLYREDWTIGAQDVAVTRSFGVWRTVRRFPRGAALRLRVERVQRRPRGRPIFPWCVEFIDVVPNTSPLRIELQRRSSVDRFLGALRSGVTLDVSDPEEPATRT